MSAKLISLPRGLGSLTTALCLVGASALGARADVKIVNKVVIAGLPVSKPKQATRTRNQATTTQTTTTQTTTTYYKGAKTRTEINSGAFSMVTIEDAQADRRYELRPRTKTYTVTSLSAYRSALNPGMTEWDFTPTAEVKPGGKTKMILGKPARNYIWIANIGMKMKAREMPKNSGANGLGTAPPQTPTLNLAMQGEQWSSEAISLPPNSPYESPSAMVASLGERIPVMKPLAEKLRQIKGLTLQSTMTQTFTGLENLPGASGVLKTMKPITVTTQAVSVSEALLPSTLFRVPAGYKQVKKTPFVTRARRSVATNMAKGHP